MSSWAKPGVKCVCVRGGTGAWKGNKTSTAAECRLPAFREIVTISAVVQTPSGAGLRFVEYPHSRLPCAIWDFAPLITKTQADDVEMFLRLASPSPLERLDLIAERLNELAEDRP